MPLNSRLKGAGDGRDFSCLSCTSSSSNGERCFEPVASNGRRSSPARVSGAALPSAASAGPELLFRRFEDELLLSDGAAAASVRSRSNEQ